jgi:hypothetical protein
LLAAGYSDERVLGVGGAIEPLWLGTRPNWFPDEFQWVVGCTYKGMPQSSAPVRNLIGCNMSFRREIFEAVGGFQTGIGRLGTRPLGCEETELCIRVRQRWPRSVLLYIPRAVVSHRVPADRARWSYFSSRCYSEGISKAMVSRLVGAGDGLASERTYVLRTLPSGILNGVQVAISRRDTSGLGRAGAIAAGLVITSAGYLVGALTHKLAAAATPQRPMTAVAVKSR